MGCLGKSSSAADRRRDRMREVDDVSVFGSSAALTFALYSSTLV
jgi:hypothetical protein